MIVSVCTHGYTHTRPPPRVGIARDDDDDRRRCPPDVRNPRTHDPPITTTCVGGCGCGSRSRRRLDDRAIRPVRHTRTRDVVHRDLVLLLHRQAERARGAHVAPRASCDARREDDGARERRRCVESTRSVELVRGTYDACDKRIDAWMMD